MKKNVNILSKPSKKDLRKRLENIRVTNYEPFSSPLIENFAKSKTYHIRTYGCQANMRDEEIMAGLLESVGFKQTRKIKEANLIILNTCCVRESAENKVIGEIGSLKSLKEQRDDLILVVSGCMVQQEHMVNLIVEKYPQVDLIFGTHNLEHIIELLDIVLRENSRVVDVMSRPLEIVERLPSVRNLKHKAFVNISYGCDKFCTYCIVPYTRGQERSRPSKEILNECQELVKNGYQEITLLGQNVNSYGKDLKNSLTFSELLEEVAKLNIPRLRFLTSHPFDFSYDIIDVMKKYDNIMKFVHLPVQSGSDEILKLMGRRYSAKQYLKIVNELRKQIPNLHLSTDIIVGFPKESDEQFEETLQLVREAKYEGAFTFIYSPRVGTPAAFYEDNVSRKVKGERFNKLVKTLEVSIQKAADEMVGKTFDVLVDGVSKKKKDILSGYTESNKLVHFPGDVSLVGQIVKVKINKSNVYSLRGELIVENA